ncbi:MAG: ATP-binding protein [Pseudomonadota bacterium]
MPVTGAARHPLRLLREVALWACPAWLAFFVGAFVGWWSLVGALAGAAVAAAVALPLAVMRRRLIEELSDVVDSWPTTRDRDPPGHDFWLADRRLVSSLRRFSAWLKERTARDAAEAAAQERLMQVLPDPLLQVDARGVVVYANNAARARFGPSTVGRPIQHTLRAPTLLQAIETAFEVDLPSQLDLQETRALGRYFQVEVQPLRIPGERPYVILVLRERTSELVSERLISDFVANASHEIRTPLTAVRGIIDTLRGPARDDAAARERFLATMATETERMNRLVSELMVLSRVERTEIERPTSTVDLLAILNAVLSSVEALTTTNGVTIHRQLPETVPPILGDADQLHQVFLNLVDNAIKYGADGGRVELTCEVLADAPPRAGRLAGLAAVGVDVVDHGQGIPPEAVPRLTERFFRVDASRSRRLGGTGLGLAIVKHIVNRHRGHLAVDSVVGEGSRFTVYVPLEDD